MARTILHVDMDAFYASVEQRDRPELRGRPVVVGGHERRGVVCAASYEARKFGVHSAMPMAQAMKLCPQAEVIRPRMGHYAEISDDLFAILGRYSPLVEALSLDEAFVDVTGEERLFGDGRAIATAIKRAVREELRLVASVGVAPVKLAAKIASDLGKPDGLCVVEEVRSFLEPLPIGRLWGVGEVTGRSLSERGYRTIGDLARAGRASLAACVGAEGAERLQALARGEDDRPVEPDRAPVSVGAEETFDADLRDRGALAVELLGQTDRACARLRAAGLRARIVTVKVKYADHTLITRRTTLPEPTVDGRVVGRTAEHLLASVPSIESRGVRLTGVSLSGLEGRDAPRQLALDAGASQRGEALGDTIDQLRAKFGDAAVIRAVHLKGPK